MERVKSKNKPRGDEKTTTPDAHLPDTLLRALVSSGMKSISRPPRATRARARREKRSLPNQWRSPEHVDTFAAPAAVSTGSGHGSLVRQAPGMQSSTNRSPLT